MFSLVETVYISYARSTTRVEKSYREAAEIRVFLLVERENYEIKGNEIIVNFD